MSKVSHFELKHLRKAIGASLSRMAHLLGLWGRNDDETVRRMENGDLQIPGAVQRVAKFMQEGVPESSMNKILPDYMICSDLQDNIEHEWIFHTRYPRFLAVISKAPLPNLPCVTVDEIEWICVAQWIDEPVDDPEQILLRAAEALRDYPLD